MGSTPAVLSMVSDTSARPSAGRSAVPAKMTSSIFPPRSARAPWAPSTHATESTMFDFPEPFGPTTTQTPGSKSSVVLSAKDLKPFSVSDRRNTGPLLRWAAVGGGLPARRPRSPLRERPHDRNPGSPTIAMRSPETIWAPEQPAAPLDHAFDRSLGPSNSASTGRRPVADKPCTRGGLRGMVAGPHALHEPVTPPTAPREPPTAGPAISLARGSQGPRPCAGRLRPGASQ